MCMFGKTNTSNKRLQEFLEILFGNFHVLARALGMAAPMLASFSGKPSHPLGPAVPRILAGGYYPWITKLDPIGILNV